MKRALSLFVVLNVFLVDCILANNTILAIVNGSPISSLSIKSDLLNTKSYEEKTSILSNRIDYALQLQIVKKLNLKISEKELEKKLSEIAKINNISIIELEAFEDFPNIEREVSERLSILSLQRFVTRDLKAPQEKILNVCSDINSHKDHKQIKIAQIIISETSTQISNLDKKNILIKDFLNKLASHIKKGASFETLAKLHSQHPSYQNGGITEWLSVNNTTLKMLDELKENEVSEIYMTDFGFAIAIKVDERFISSKLKECEEQIIYDNAESYYSNWLIDLRDQANVEIYYDKLL